TGVQTCALPISPDEPDHRNSCGRVGESGKGKQVPPLRRRSGGSGRDDEEERAGGGTGGGSRYRMRQQQGYGCSASRALQWWAIGCTEAPRKSGESAGEFRSKAGKRRGAASQTVQTPESWEQSSDARNKVAMSGASEGRAGGCRNRGRVKHG